jgi:hypothetical protein
VRHNRSLFLRSSQSSPSPEAQVELERKRFLVDVMHRPATLCPLHSLAYYAYTRMYELLSTFFLGAGINTFCLSAERGSLFSSVVCALSSTPPATHPTSGTHQKPHAHESLLSYEPDALSSVTSSKPGVRAGYRWVLPQDLSRAQLVLLDKLGSGVHTVCVCVCVRLRGGDRLRAVS